MAVNVLQTSMYICTKLHVLIKARECPDTAATDLTCLQYVRTVKYVYEPALRNNTYRD
jgi:hypothetical protein